MIKPGSRWKSGVGDAEAVVIRAPKTDGVPQCGGVDMSPFGQPIEAAPVVAGFEAPCQAGKRYHSSDGIELLCTKGGSGTLGFDGAALELVETKKLPASD